MNQNDSGQQPLDQHQRLGDVQIPGSGNNFANAQGNNVEINQKTEIYISVAEIKTRKLNVASPYKGLEAFKFEDAERFFGRDQFLVELNKELEQTNLLLLLGASGSGKSSVVRAGLIPSLQRRYSDRFVSLMLTPDRDPFESFYASLLSQGCKQSQVQLLRAGQANKLGQAIKVLKEQKPESFVLVFIDQFEEIFTVSESEKRDRFIQDVCHLSEELSKKKIPDVKIVATMRSDFLSYFDPFPANLLAKLTEKHRPLITQMQPDQLRLAIEQPAAHHGVVFEEGLVEEIIKDLQRQAGYLPLLQYTLDLLWKSEVRNGGLQDRTLNIRSYRESGGVREALQCHADKIYANLSKPQRLAAQRIFLRLVAINGDEAGETEWKPVRHRASRAQFGDGVEQEVLALLIDQKLLVSDASFQVVDRQQRKIQDSTVEIAHEILLTAWTTLKVWIQENRKSIALRNRLNDDVKIWQKTKADSDLWSGAKLTQVVELRKDSTFQHSTFQQVLGGFNDEEQEFIQASASLRRRSKRRTYLGLGAIGSTLLLAAGFWGWLSYTPYGQLTQIRRNLTNLSQRVSSEYQEKAAVAFAKDEKLAQALELTNQIEDSTRKADVLSDIAQAYGAIDQPQTAAPLLAPLLEKTIDSVHQIEDPALKAIALSEIAQAYGAIDQPQTAAPLLEQAIALTDQIEAPYPEIDVLRAIAQAYGAIDQPQRATSLLEQATTLAYQDDVSYTKVKALHSIAQTYGALGQPQRATSLLEQATTSANQIEDSQYPQYKAYAIRAIAQTCATLDQPQAAAPLLAPLLEQVIDSVHQIEDPYIKASALGAIAQAYGTLDQPQRAAPLLEQAIAFANQIEDPTLKASALRDIARAYGTLDPQRAAPLLEQAIAFANQIEGSYAKDAASIAIAQIVANQKNWGQALEATQQCSGDECKVESLAEVLTIHAEQQHPQLKEGKEENEQNDEE